MLETALIDSQKKRFRLDRSRACLDSAQIRLSRVLSFVEPFVPGEGHQSWERERLQKSIATLTADYERALAEFNTADQRVNELRARLAQGSNS